MNSPLNSSLPRLGLCLCALLAFSVACNRGPSQPSAATGQPAAKRYSLKGRVVFVDKNAGTANIDNEPIAGFRGAMIMPYTIKPPSRLDQLQPGDSITADVVVESDKYWLENVKVTGHSQSPAAKPAASVHIPTPGDPVPDFRLINQKRQEHFLASISRPDPASHSDLHALPVSRLLPTRQIQQRARVVHPPRLIATVRNNFHLESECLFTARRLP